VCERGCIIIILFYFKVGGCGFEWLASGSFYLFAQILASRKRRFHSAIRSHQIPLVLNLKIGTVSSTDRVCCSGVLAMVPNNAVKRVLKRFHTDMWVLV
jgi:hypothetical protein